MEEFSKPPAHDAADLTKRLELLEQRVRLLQAKEDIRDCLRRYTRAVDRDDADLMASAFHHDARLHYAASVAQSPEEFSHYGLALVRERWSSFSHHLEIKAIDLDGDVAHTDSYLWFSMKRIGEDFLDAGSARYIDRLERRDEKWKIAERLVLMETSGVMPAGEVIANARAGARNRSDPSYQRPLKVA